MSIVPDIKTTALGLLAINCLNNLETKVVSDSFNRLARFLETVEEAIVMVDTAGLTGDSTNSLSNYDKIQDVFYSLDNKFIFNSTSQLEPKVSVLKCITIRRIQGKKISPRQISIMQEFLEALSKI